MKNKKWILLCASLALIAGTAALLERLKTHPRLGHPGIRATPIEGDIKMKIDLPERVSGFISTNVPEPELVLGYLPPDTSYAERRYQSLAGGFPIESTVVLMGADRTSIHNADYCLRGQGLNPDEKKVASISVDGAPLPVSEWKVSGVFQRPGGEKIKVNGVYVFWFVTDGAETPGHFDMMKRLALNLLKTGVLQRWAYVSYFSQCAPGEEDATFERMKNLIASSAGQYEIFPDKEIAAVKN